MLETLYKIGEVHFRLLGTNGFHARAKNERFTAAGLRCRQNLKNENFTSSFGRLRQNIATTSVPHVLHDYFSSFNLSNHSFVTSSLPLLSSFLKLPNTPEMQICLEMHTTGCMTTSIYVPPHSTLPSFFRREIQIYKDHKVSS